MVRSRTSATGGGLRRLGAALLLLGLALAGLSTVAAAGEHGPRIDVLDVEGIIDPTVERYLRDGLAEAAEEGAAAVVLQLDSPGAMDVDVAGLAGDIAASEVPVVAYAGPGGAQLSGGALALWEAAHVRALAPATLVGPAEPLDLAEEARGAVDGEADAAVLAGLGEAHDREALLAARTRGGAVVVPAPAGVAELPEDARLPHGVQRADATVVDADELVEEGAAELAASSLPDALRAAGEVEVARPDGTSTPVLADSSEARTRFNNMGVLAQTAHALATPALAYLLVVGGLLCLAFEWFQPGFGVAGVAGLGLLAAGSYGLWVLPTSWLGVALLVGGVALLSVDTAAGGFGAVTLGGAVAFAAGSWLTFVGAGPLAPAWWVLAAVVAFVLVFFIGILTSVLRAQGQQASTSAEALVGETAVVRSMLNPEGHVFVGGGLWRARAPEEAGRVKTGTPVQVVGLDDRLTLQVEPAAERDDATSEHAST